MKCAGIVVSAISHMLPGCPFAGSPTSKFTIEEGSSIDVKTRIYGTRRSSQLTEQQNTIDGVYDLLRLTKNVLSARWKGRCVQRLGKFLYYGFGASRGITSGRSRTRLSRGRKSFVWMSVEQPVLERFCSSNPSTSSSARFSSANAHSFMASHLVHIQPSHLSGSISWGIFS